MTPTAPSKLALVLLHRFADGNEPLIGDLLEEFERRRSQTWLWRQVLMAGVAHYRRRLSGSENVILDLGLGSTPRQAPLPLPWKVNLNGVPDAGVGGLGLVALAVLVTVVMSVAWWIAALGVAGGALLGAGMVMRRRSRGLSDPGAPRPTTLFDGPPTPGGRPPLRMLMNLSAVEVSGVGGLGLVALAAVISIVVPQLRWPMFAALAGGVVAGAMRVARGRRLGLSDPGRTGPASLFGGTLNHADREKPMSRPPLASGTFGLRAI